MTEQLKTSIKVSQQSSNCSDSRTSFMGGTARGSFKIQGQNISKDQSYKSNPQMHILHLSTSFYLCLSACWNLWVTENNSGKQDSLKVGDVFQKRYNRYRYISQACESAGGLANESVIVSHYTALIIRQIILLCVLYVACLMSMGGSSQMTRQEEEKLMSHRERGDVCECEKNRNNKREPQQRTEELQEETQIPHLVFEVDLYGHQKTSISRLLNLVLWLLTHCK